MSQQYRCPGCDNRVVLVNSGGVHRRILCKYCNCEMRVEKSVETEWIGDTDEHADDKWKVAEE